MSKTRVVVVVAVFGGCLSALATRTRDARPASVVTSCGIERWAIKTAKDRPALVAAKPVTVGYLVTRPAPTSLPPTRLPFERRAFTVFAAVTLVRHEADGDLHVVLRDRGSHMIAEAPMPSCTVGAKPAIRRAMANARSQVRVCGRAKITGVAFFDFNHGQTGVVPNAIELHPILGFHCLSG